MAEQAEKQVAVLRWSVRKALLSAAALVAIGGCTGRSLAANAIWLGAADTTFENGSNWSGGTGVGGVPASDLTTQVAQFGSAAAGTVVANQPALSASRSILGLNFITTASGWTLGSGSAAYVLNIGASGITSANTSGSNSISANLNLGAAQSWNVANSGTLLFSGSLSGNNALTINSGNTAGTVNFSGSNAYGATYTVHNGTAVIGGVASGGGTLTTSAGGAMQLTGDFSAFAGTIDLASNSAAKTHTFSGSANNLAGAKLVLEGSAQAFLNTLQWTGAAGSTVQIGELSGNTFGRLTNATASSTATFQVGALNTSSTFAGLISNTGSGGTAGVAALTKTGTGTLTLGGLNNYTGATTVTGGVLKDLSQAAASTTTTASVTSGYSMTVNDASGFVVGQSINISGVGSRTITVINGNTIYTSNNFTVASGTTVSSSAVETIGGSIAATGGTSNIALSGGVFGLGGNGSSTFSRGLGTGVTQVQFTGDGGFAAYTSNRAVNLGGSGAAVSWGSTAGFLADGKNLLLSAADADATVDFQNAINTNGAVRTIQVANGSSAVDGVLSGGISGSGGIAKTGEGTLRLSGSNSYTGNTVVQRGTLALSAASGNIASSAVVIVGDTPTNTSAVLDVTGVTGGFHIANGQTLSGDGSVVGNATVDGILSPGVGVGTLSMSGNVAMGDGGTLAINLSGAASNKIAVAGSLDLSSLSDAISFSGTPLSGIDYVLATYTGTLTGTFNSANTPSGFSIDYGTGTNSQITLVSVPEPASLALLAMAGACSLRRRQKAN